MLDSTCDKISVHFFVDKGKNISVEVNYGKSYSHWDFSCWIGDFLCWHRVALGWFDVRRQKQAKIQ